MATPVESILSTGSVTTQIHSPSKAAGKRVHIDEETQDVALSILNVDTLSAPLGSHISSRKPINPLAFSSPKKTKQITELFPSEQQMVMTGSSFSLENVTGSYLDPKGRNLTLVKQADSKSCGPTCSLMLLLDQIQPSHEKAVPITNNEFIGWIYNGSMTDASDLSLHLTTILHLTRLKFHPVVLNFIKDSALEEYQKIKASEEADNHVLNPLMHVFKKAESEEIFFKDGFSILSSIAEIIKKTNNSVIIAIEHPDVDGHWIIVDHVDEGHVYVRDPYAGKAYCLPKVFIACLINDGCSKIEGLYLKKD